MKELVPNKKSVIVPFAKSVQDSLSQCDLDGDSDNTNGSIFEHGKFAFISKGSLLQIVNIKSGQQCSACDFSTTEQKVVVTCVVAYKCKFIVGLRCFGTGNIGLLCVYDPGLSRIVKTIQLNGVPSSIVLVREFGGVNIETSLLNPALRSMFGIVAVGTEDGHLLLVDIRADDENIEGQSVSSPSTLLFIDGVEDSSIPKLRDKARSYAQHCCLNLTSDCVTQAGFKYRLPESKVILCDKSNCGITSLLYLKHSVSLVVGYSFGAFQIWSLGSLKVLHSSPFVSASPVCHFTYQEPENDPRYCFFLWVGRGPLPSQTQCVHPTSITMYQIVYAEKDVLESYGVLYKQLGIVVKRFEHQLTGDAHHLVDSTSVGSRIISFKTLGSTESTVSVVVWETPVTPTNMNLTCHMGIFDLNCYYEKQLPNSVREAMYGKMEAVCPFLAFYSLTDVAEDFLPSGIIDVFLDPQSINWFRTSVPPQVEQFSWPSSASFQLSCLSESGTIAVEMLGMQKQIISNMIDMGADSFLDISKLVQQCCVAGLLHSSYSCIKENEESLCTDALLSIALDNGGMVFVTSCIRKWSHGSITHAGHSLKLLHDWAWAQVVQRKRFLDELHFFLFGSGEEGLDEGQLNQLQKISIQLRDLTEILIELQNCKASSLEDGIKELAVKVQVTTHLTMYGDILVLLVDSQLLPEQAKVADNDKPAYNAQLLSEYYQVRRKGAIDDDVLFIDTMWKSMNFPETLKEENNMILYPPPSVEVMCSLFVYNMLNDGKKSCFIFYYWFLDICECFPDLHDKNAESKFREFTRLERSEELLVKSIWLLDHKLYSEAISHLLVVDVKISSVYYHHIVKLLYKEGEKDLLALFFANKQPNDSCTIEQMKSLTYVMVQLGKLSNAYDLQTTSIYPSQKGHLFQFFIKQCIQNQMLQRLFMLPLNQEEENILHNYLLTSKGTEDCLLVYYLERGLYTEASKLTKSLQAVSALKLDEVNQNRLQTQCLLANGFSNTIPPIQQKCYETTENFPEEFNSPLSSILLKGDKNLACTAFLSASTEKHISSTNAKRRKCPLFEAEPICSKKQKDLDISVHNVEMTSPIPVQEITSVKESNPLSLLTTPASAKRRFSKISASTVNKPPQSILKMKPHIQQEIDTPISSGKRIRFVDVKSPESPSFDGSFIDNHTKVEVSFVQANAECSFESAEETELDDQEPIEPVEKSNLITTDDSYKSVDIVSILSDLENDEEIVEQPTKFRRLSLNAQESIRDILSKSKDTDDVEEMVTASPERVSSHENSPVTLVTEPAMENELDDSVADADAGTPVSDALIESITPPDGNTDEAVLSTSIDANNDYSHVPANDLDQGNQTNAIDAKPETFSADVLSKDQEVIQECLPNEYELNVTPSNTNAYEAGDVSDLTDTQEEEFASPMGEISFSVEADRNKVVEKQAFDSSVCISNAKAPEEGEIIISDSDDDDNDDAEDDNEDPSEDDDGRDQVASGYSSESDSETEVDPCDPCDGDGEQFVDKYSEVADDEDDDEDIYENMDIGQDAGEYSDDGVVDSFSSVSRNEMSSYVDESNSGIPGIANELERGKDSTPEELPRETYKPLQTTVEQDSQQEMESASGVHLECLPDKEAPSRVIPELSSEDMPMPGLRQQEAVKEEHTFRGQSPIHDNGIIDVVDIDDDGTDDDVEDDLDRDIDIQDHEVEEDNGEEEDDIDNDVDDMRSVEDGESSDTDDIDSSESSEYDREDDIEDEGSPVSEFPQSHSVVVLDDDDDDDDNEEGICSKNLQNEDNQELNPTGDDDTAHHKAVKEEESVSSEVFEYSEMGAEESGIEESVINTATQEDVEVESAVVESEQELMETGNKDMVKAAVSLDLMGVSSEAAAQVMHEEAGDTQDDVIDVESADVANELELIDPGNKDRAKEAVSQDLLGASSEGATHVINEEAGYEVGEIIEPSSLVRPLVAEDMAMPLCNNQEDVSIIHAIETKEDVEMEISSESAREGPSCSKINLADEETIAISTEMRQDMDIAITSDDTYVFAKSASMGSESEQVDETMDVNEDEMEYEKSKVCSTPIHSHDELQTDSTALSTVHEVSDDSMSVDAPVKDELCTVNETTCVDADNHIMIEDEPFVLTDSNVQLSQILVGKHSNDMENRYTAAKEIKESPSDISGGHRPTLPVTIPPNMSPGRSPIFLPAKVAEADDSGSDKSSDYNTSVVTTPVRALRRRTVYRRDHLTPRTNKFRIKPNSSMDQEEPVEKDAHISDSDAQVYEERYKTAQAAHENKSETKTLPRRTRTSSRRKTSECHSDSSVSSVDSHRRVDDGNSQYFTIDDDKSSDAEIEIESEDLEIYLGLRRNTANRVKGHAKEHEMEPIEEEKSFEQEAVEEAVMKVEPVEITKPSEKENSEAIFSSQSEEIYVGGGNEDQMIESKLSERVEQSSDTEESEERTTKRLTRSHIHSLPKAEELPEHSKRGKQLKSVSRKTMSGAKTSVSWALHPSMSSSVISSQKLEVRVEELSQQLSPLKSENELLVNMEKLAPLSSEENPDKEESSTDVEEEAVPKRATRAQNRITRTTRSGNKVISDQRDKSWSPKSSPKKAASKHLKSIAEPIETVEPIEIIKYDNASKSSKARNRRVPNVGNTLSTVESDEVIDKVFVPRTTRSLKSSPDTSSQSKISKKSRLSTSHNIEEQSPREGTDAMDVETKKTRGAKSLVKTRSTRHTPQDQSSEKYLETNIPALRSKNIRPTRRTNQDSSSIENTEQTVSNSADTESMSSVSKSQFTQQATVDLSVKDKLQTEASVSDIVSSGALTKTRSSRRNVQEQSLEEQYDASTDEKSTSKKRSTRQTKQNQSLLETGESSMSDAADTSASKVISKTRSTRQAQQNQFSETATSDAMDISKGAPSRNQAKVKKSPQGAKKSNTSKNSRTLRNRIVKT